MNRKSKSINRSLWPNTPGRMQKRWLFSEVIKMRKRKWPMRRLVKDNSKEKLRLLNPKIRRVRTVKKRLMLDVILIFS